YDGSLTTQERMTGPVNGVIGYAYDDYFRLDALPVAAGDPPSEPPATTNTYGYDADRLLTTATSTPHPTLGPAAAPALARNAQHGLLDATTVGNVADQWSWYAYAEPTNYIAKVNNAPVLTFAYERDALGRITQKTETL